MHSFPVSATRLTGDDLLDAVRLMTDKVTRSEMCRICGYYTEEGNNTKLHFTDFYEAILLARGVDVEGQIAESKVTAEDEKYQETIDELLEDGADADAIEAFIELYGEEELGNFEDAYQGEMTGAEFAEQLVTDCYCMDIPSFVCVDWEATWQQLEYDYDEQDGHIFSRNW